MNAKIIMLPTPIIVSDEEIKNGDAWVYINQKEWDIEQDYTITVNNLGSEWFEKLWDKANYKKVISHSKQIDYNGIDFGVADLLQAKSVAQDLCCNVSDFMSGVRYSQQLNEKKFNLEELEKCWIQATRKTLEPLKQDGFSAFVASLFLPKTYDIEIEESENTIKILKKL